MESVAENNVSSYRTAITRKGPSAPLKYIEGSLRPNTLILDYGCGRGADVSYLRKKGYCVDGYDPYYSNIDLSGKDSYYDVVLCNYVFNVLDKSEENTLMQNIMSKLKSGGKAYISVRRDSFVEGYTSRGYQRYVRLEGHSSFEKKGAFEIYFITK